MAKITHLDLEISSTCQASCSACARNQSGVTVIDPTSHKLKEVQRAFKSISKDLKTITFCGNIGDSMGNKDIALICRWFIMRNPDILINIHTNGGLGSPDTYRELATLGVRIIFGLDGLEDTNHYHRAGVKWSNVVKNLEAYQSGFANKIKCRWTEEFNDDDDNGEYKMGIIQMILWQHNQHQILDMARFAQTHKCSLWFRKAVITKDQNANNGMPVFTPKGQYVCNLHEPDAIFDPISGYEFPCPDTWHPDNDIETKVTEFMDNACTELGINIHKWKRILDNPILPDTENAPENVNDWSKHVPVRWMHDKRQEQYNVKYTDEQLDRFSIPVACKSMNWNNPVNIQDKEADKELFIGADSYVSPCCMIGSALSLHLQNALDDDDNSEPNLLKKDIANRIEAIGIDKFNSKLHSMQEIYESGVLHQLVFDNIEDNDARNGRQPFCAAHCGTRGSYGRPIKDDRDNG